MLDALRAALLAAKDDPVATRALAQAYAAAAQKLPEDKAPQASRRRARRPPGRQGRPSNATSALAQAYAAAAQKLPEDKARAGEAVAAVLDALLAAKGEPIATRDLAQAYAAAARAASDAKREAASTLLAASDQCLTETSGCLAAVTAPVQSLDADRPLPSGRRGGRNLPKVPQLAVADESPADTAGRLRPRPPPRACDRVVGVSWLAVAEKYPEIDLTSGPSVERLAAGRRLEMMAPSSLPLQPLGAKSLASC